MRMEHNSAVAVLVAALLLPRAGKAFGQVTPDEFKRKVAAEMQALRDEGKFPASDAIAAEYEGTLDKYIDRSPYLATARQQEYFLLSLRVYFERVANRMPGPEAEVEPGQDFYDKCYAMERYVFMGGLNKFATGGVPSSADIGTIREQVAQTGNAYAEAIRRCFPNAEPWKVQYEVTRLADELGYRTSCGFAGGWSRPLSEEELQKLVGEMDLAVKEALKQDSEKEEGDTTDYLYIAFWPALWRCGEVGRDAPTAQVPPVFSRQELLDGRAEAAKEWMAAIAQWNQAVEEYWKYSDVRNLAKEARGRIDSAVAGAALDDADERMTGSTDSAVEVKSEVIEAPAAPSAAAPAENAQRNWLRNGILAIVAVAGFGFAVVRMLMARRRKD